MKCFNAVFSWGDTFGSPQCAAIQIERLTQTFTHVDAAGCVQCDVLAIKLSIMNDITTCCCSCLDTPKCLYESVLYFWTGVE